jgi:hypothetical protein
MRLSARFFALTLACLGTSRVRADVSFDNGAVNNLSTNLNDNAVVRDSTGSPATTLNILSGWLVKNWTLEGRSSLNVNQPLANAILGTLSTYGSSTAFAWGRGSPFFDLAVHGSTQVATTGVVQADSHSADGFGTLTILETEGISLTPTGHSTVNVESYDNHGSIVASGSATMVLNNMIMHGGSLSVLDSATVALLGVQAGCLPNWALAVSVIVTGKLTVYRPGFNYGLGALPDDKRTLTGRLEDGTLFEMTFTGGHNIYLASVPEPLALALAGLGLLSLAGYSSRRRSGEHDEARNDRTGRSPEPFPVGRIAGGLALFLFS